MFVINGVGVDKLLNLEAGFFFRGCFFFILLGEVRVLEG